MFHTKDYGEADGLYALSSLNNRRMSIYDFARKKGPFSEQEIGDISLQMLL